MARKRPKKKRGKTVSLSEPVPRPDYNKSTPRYCFRHIDPTYCARNLTKELRADLVSALEKRGSMTWSDLIFAPKHGLGQEMIPADQIKCAIPEKFQDADKFVVFRYSDRLPMVGVRAEDTFHILWVAPDYESVYDH